MAAADDDNEARLERIKQLWVELQSISERSVTQKDRIAREDLTSRIRYESDEYRRAVEKEAADA